MENFFDLQNPTSYFWLIVGIISILIEITAVPGIGFLFAGLGAMTLGVLITFDLISLPGEWTEHIAYFFFFTTVWAVILWRPLKNAIKNKQGEEGYQNIIGSTAETLEEMEIGKISNVKWSGTTMRARISNESKLKNIPAGETVWVHKNKGGVLHVDIEELN